MLVAVCQSLPERASPESALAEPGISLAIQNFRAAIGNSLFSGEAPSAIARGDTPRVCFCSGDFVLRFRREDSQAVDFSVLEKLMELLKAAGADWLIASLCLGPQTEGQARALLIRLEAQGPSREQANLRWCLGVAHLQQALLFTSRHLRQQIGQ